MRSWPVNAVTGDGRPAASPTRLAAGVLQASRYAGHLSSWKLWDCTRIKPLGISWMLLRGHKDGCGSKGVIRGLFKLTRHKLETDHPGWVIWARVYDVERPETPNDPRLHH